MAEEHVFHPNVKVDSPKLQCFLDDGRECGADCMAYVEAPEGPDYVDRQWANCMLLVNIHRTGKHLIVLASCASNAEKASKNEAADRARTNQPTPPKVG